MIMTMINKDNVSWWWPWIGRPVDPHMSLLGSLSHLKIIFNVWWFLDLLEKEDLLFMIQISSQSLSLVMMIMKMVKRYHPINVSAQLVVEPLDVKTSHVQASCAIHWKLHADVMMMKKLHKMMMVMTMMMKMKMMDFL